MKPAEDILESPTPKRVLGVAAHSDDLEYIAGGSMAKWAAEGAEVYILILTAGEKGTNDAETSPEQLRLIRRQEQQAAADILGIKKVFFAEYGDGTLEANLNVKRDITRIIRTVRPDTVITWDPAMAYCVARRFINHPDHIAAGQATLAAVFPLCRDPLSFPELLQEEKLAPCNVNTVLLFNFETTNCFVDITNTLSTKISARDAHKSQAQFPADSPCDITTVAKDFGRRYGVRRAEAFIRIDID
jgi:LmbE family N-acetylglucosaminyl deacetylase